MSDVPPYKSVVLRLAPPPKEAKILDKVLVKVSKLLEIGKREFQKIIWHRWREEFSEGHTRLIDLLSQRFASTVMENKIIPLDERNYKVVKVNGWYNIELKLLMKPKRAAEKLYVPICRSDCDYYGEILEGSAYPAFIFKEGGNYFLSVSIPLAAKYDENRPTVFFGIDLNMYKHAASLYNPQTGRFEVNKFFDLKPTDAKVKELQRMISRIQRGRRTAQLGEDEKDKIRGLYLTIKEVIKKAHGDFISELIEVADGYWKRGYNVVFVLENLKGITKRIEKIHPSFNRWLHSQWCYRKFATILETKEYPVEYVDPRGTSVTCHRCGNKGETYGRHKRLFKCKSCGLRDFNRDLNAARNLALKLSKASEGDGKHGLLRV